MFFLFFLAVLAFIATLGILSVIGEERQKLFKKSFGVAIGITLLQPSKEERLLLQPVVDAKLEELKEGYLAAIRSGTKQDVAVRTLLDAMALARTFQFSVSPSFLKELLWAQQVPEIFDKRESDRLAEQVVEKMSRELSPRS